MPLSVYNEMISIVTPPGVPKTWIDENIEQVDTTNELWQWETMLMFHFKTPIDEIVKMDDKTFFFFFFRLKGIIEQEL